MSARVETVVAATEEATREVARALATRLAPGDVVALEGPLGAGKTHFAQALLAALGVEGPVTSPTFALVNRYVGAGDLAVLHADLYRLGDDDECYALGIWDDVADGALLVVEWPERAPSVLEAARVRVRLEDLGPSARRVTVSEAARA